MGPGRLLGDREIPLGSGEGVGVERPCVAFRSARRGGEDRVDQPHLARGIPGVVPDGEARRFPHARVVFELGAGAREARRDRMRGRRIRAPEVGDRTLERALAQMQVTSLPVEAGLRGRALDQPLGGVEDLERLIGPPEPREHAREGLVSVELRAVEAKRGAELALRVLQAFEPRVTSSEHHPRGGVVRRVVHDSLPGTRRLLEVARAVERGRFVVVGLHQNGNQQQREDGERDGLTSTHEVTPGAPASATPGRGHRPPGNLEPGRAARTASSGPELDAGSEPGIDHGCVDTPREERERMRTHLAIPAAGQSGRMSPNKRNPGSRRGSSRAKSSRPRSGEKGVGD